METFRCRPLQLPPGHRSLPGAGRRSQQTPPHPWIPVLRSFLSLAGTFEFCYKDPKCVRARARVHVSAHEHVHAAEACVPTWYISTCLPDIHMQLKSKQPAQVPRGLQACSGKSEEPPVEGCKLKTGFLPSGAREQPHMFRRERGLGKLTIWDIYMLVEFLPALLTGLGIGN